MRSVTHRLSSFMVRRLSSNVRLEILASYLQPTVCFAVSCTAGYEVTLSSGHYIENIGNDTLRFLEIFNTGV